MNKEKLSKLIFFICAIVSIAAVIMIGFFLLLEGLPAIKEVGFVNFIFGQKWKPVDTPPSFGIFTMIVGSIYVTGLAIIIGVPIGVFCSIFLYKYCHNKLYKIIKPAINLLAGIPSIVYGFFGMELVVPFIKNNFGGNGFSVLSTGIILAIMILPTIISLSESSLRSVPSSYYEGSIGLGASKEQSLFKVILPAAKSGIFTSVILGIGRAIGETMAVVMVSGGAVMPLNKIGLLKPIRTLTNNIVMEMSYSSGLHTKALIATGVVLLVFILILNISISLIKNGGKNEKN